MPAVRMRQLLVLVCSSLAAAAAADMGAPVGGHPPPPPPAITFDSTLSDYAVLQQTPSVAQVYGTTNSTAVTVTVSGSGCPSQTSHASLFNGTWVAKVPGARGGNCTIVATDAAGNSANLTSVTYGDVSAG